MADHLPHYDELYVVSDIHMGGKKDSNVDFQIFNKGKRLAGLILTLVDHRPTDDIAFVLNGDIIDSLAEEEVKRIALLHASRQQDAEANEAYREAMAEDATEGVKYHWTATQYLSLAAWLDRGPDPDTHDRVTHLAKAELLKARDPSRTAWAHGSLAELTLLGLYHRDTDKLDIQDIKRRVAEHCRAIVDLMGYESFHVKSTGRQFKRYRDQWQKDEWLPAVEAALRALDETDSEDVEA